MLTYLRPKAPLVLKLTAVHFREQGVVLAQANAVTGVFARADEPGCCQPLQPGRQTVSRQGVYFLSLAVAGRTASFVCHESYLQKGMRPECR